MNLTDRLSPHFTLEEMTRTSVASLQEQNRALPIARREALTALCTYLLEPIRTHYDKPLVVHSGYRCEALNAAIGGSASSQHRLGEAADFHVKGVPLQEVFDWIRLASGLRWGQLILESGRVGRAPSWIHISLGHPYRPAAKSQQVLVFDGRSYTRLA